VSFIRLFADADNHLRIREECGVASGATRSGVDGDEVHNLLNDRTLKDVTPFNMCYLNLFESSQPFLVPMTQTATLNSLFHVLFSLAFHCVVAMQV
jgi:hypothetical protein